MEKVKQLKITLIKSTNKAVDVQKKTVAALGLSRPNNFNIVPDNATIRGMIARVNHMVKVEEI